MTQLWRIHLLAGKEDTEEEKNMCIISKRMAIGWPCQISQDNIQEYRKKFDLIAPQKNG